MQFKYIKELIILNVTPLPVKINSICISKPRIDLYYPSVELCDKKIQNKINTCIYNTVYKMICCQGFYEDSDINITGSYEIKNNQRNVLSISLINYAYSGGAHGLTLIKSLTFDINTGRKVELKDLFNKNSNYVNVLSNIVKAQIQARDIPTFNEFTHIAPDQDFYIADKSLVLYFQLYELTYYAYGFPYFPISVYSIENIIDENSVLGRML